MSAETLHTSRLLLRRPTVADAGAIFDRYASDPAVTRYLIWPTHRSVADTELFVAFSEEEWGRWPAGPLLVFSAADGRLLGGSGLGFESLHQASTGYVLARDAWGLGYATELTGLMVELAAALGVSRLTATCHHAHTASRHVLEKSGFTNDGILPRHVVFPNISRQLQDAYSYSRVIAP
jgi:RimJ/RimL family protein N-acetyltransferase